MNVAVVIPYAARDKGRQEPARQRALRLVTSYWLHEFPLWKLQVGTLWSAGPFNKAALVNQCVADLPAGVETIVLADADSLVPSRQVEAAVEAAARDGQGPVSAFTIYGRLSRVDTAGLRDYRQAFQTTPEWTMDSSGSTGCLAISRDCWDRLGGMDERFVGYGYEDLAFWLHAHAVFGPAPQVGGSLVHLWHPRSEGSHPELERANRERYDRYLSAVGDIDLVEDVLRS